MAKYEQINKWLEKLWEQLKRPWLKWSLLLTAIFIGLSVIIFLFIIYGGRLVVDQEALVMPATTTVVTEDGDYAGRLYQENRKLVQLSEIPDHVQEAFIAIEDVRFYSHAGVDFRSVARAVYRDIVALDKVEGASTITQQLAKNLFLTNEKSWMRKTQEVMASIYLERQYTKNDILELYLNQVYFGHGIHGVGTAAEYFFGKPVGELSVAEGALLAGVINAPSYYSPHNDLDRSMERRNLVIRQMERAGYLTVDSMLSIQGQTSTVIDPTGPSEPWIDDYLELVIQEASSLYQISRAELQRGGYEITVYLDPVIQKIAYDKIQDDTFFHGSEPNIEAAFVLMDQEAGQLRSVIGGRDYAIGQDHHRALIQRQPGSVIKPLAVYAPALAEGYSPYLMLDDTERDYDGYHVRNANGEYEGEVSMYDAVTVSKNTSTVWLLDQIGISASKEYLEKMNMFIPDTGLALGLGGLTYGLTPIQIAEGYRTFIHNGEWTGAHAIAKITDRYGEVIAEATPETEQVFPKKAAWDMLRMLENVVEEGTATPGDYEKALAGKTGTTQHPQAPGKVKDSWFSGITPEYVTTLWIGYDISDEDHYLTVGSRAPTELTKAILTEVDRKQSLSESFTLPDDIEDLPEPIYLPVITDLDASFRFVNWRSLRGQLSWTPARDERIVYHIYEVGRDGADDQYLGRVVGEDTFTLADTSLFRQSSYYIVPYNSLTDRSGIQSNSVNLSLFD